MSAESIIKINVDDKAFKDFVSVFDKYKKALAGMPKAWTKSDKSAKEYAANSEKSLKNLTKNQKDFTKTLGDGAYVLKNIAKTSSDIARNFASSALSVAKWLSYGALGGGFGLSALAASTSNTRRQAQGLGVSTGDLRATSVNFGKYIDAESTLSKISDIQNDLSRRQILTRLGGREGQNAAEMLPEIIKNVISQFKAGGQSSQYAEALGLTQILSMEELRRLTSLPEKELQETIQNFNKDRKTLSVDDADGKLLQDFWIQLKRSAEQLETTFIKALSPITPQLINLSQAITTAITDFLGSKEVKQALQEFTSWIGSGEAKQAIKDFIEGIGEIADKLKWVAGIFYNKKHADTPPGAKDENGYTYKDGKIDSDNPDNYWGGKWLNFMNPNYRKALEKSKIRTGAITGAPISERFNNPGNLRSWKGVPTVDSGGASGAFAQFATKEDGLRALGKQLQLYQNRDNLDTISQIMSKYSPSNENNTAAAIANISKMSGYGADERLNLNDNQILSRLISAITRQENSQSNYTPTVVNQVLVNNAAGADLVVSANAMR